MISEALKQAAADLAAKARGIAPSASVTVMRGPSTCLTIHCPSPPPELTALDGTAFSGYRVSVIRP